MRARTYTAKVLTAVVGAVAAASAARAQLPAGAPAAVVNGEPITLAEVEAVLKQRPPTATAPTEAQRREMQQEALSMLIDDTLMYQFLRKNTPPVPPAEVAKKIGELTTALKAQNHTLQDYLRETNQSEADLHKGVALMLAKAAYVKAHVSDADVQKYYLENKDFFDQVMVRASHIVLRISPGAADAERMAARIKLERLREDIVSGKIDFAEAAKKYSQCPSAPEGGDIGKFPRKWAVDENFARAAFALQKGQVSGVVQTDYGLHLIKVTDRTAGQPSEFEKVKEEVREMAAEEMLQGVLAEQRKAAKIVVNLSTANPPR